MHLLIVQSEVLEDAAHTQLHGLQIESVNTDAEVHRKGGVVLAEPSDETQHVGVRPHPTREPLEAVEDFLGGPGFVWVGHHEAVQVACVGSIPLDENRGEIARLDEVLRQAVPVVVVLVTAVRTGGGGGRRRSALVEEDLEQLVTGNWYARRLSREFTFRWA